MISKEDLLARIDRKEYWQVPGTALTVCCLVFKNGFVQTGESCAANPDEFNAELGKQYAFEDAISKSLRYLAWEQANERKS